MFQCHITVRLDLIHSLQFLLLRLVLLLCDLDRFECALNGKRQQRERQDHLDHNRRENHEDERSDLRTCQVRWHHDRDQVIVDHNYVGFVGVLLPEIHDEPSERCQEDREARYCDRRLGCEVKECYEDWDGDSATADACDVGERHDQTEGNQATDLEPIDRKNFLVAANALLLHATLEPGMIQAVFVFRAGSLKQSN